MAEEKEPFITRNLALAYLANMDCCVMADLYMDEGGDPEDAEVLCTTGNYPYLVAKSFRTPLGIMIDFLYEKKREIALSMSFKNLAIEVRTIIGNDIAIHYFLAKANPMQLRLILAITT